MEDENANNRTRDEKTIGTQTIDCMNSYSHSHCCTPGERGISPAVRSQRRQLFCQTHSVFINCVLYPCPDGHTIITKDTLDKKRVRKTKSVFSEFTKTQFFVLVSLALGNLLSFCSMSILAPFFPLEASSKGMGVSLAGCVFSFYALVVSIASPVLGKLLPKIGAKTLFITGMLVAGVSNILFGLLPMIEDYAWFTACSFLIRGLEALGAGAFSTSSFVFVVELFPERISSVLGVLETFIGLGMSVGPALGGVLYSIGGFGLPFTILGVMMLAVVPLNYFMLPAAEGTQADEEATGSFWKLVRIPSTFVIVGIIVISSNVWSFLDPTLEPHLRMLQLSSQQVGFVFLLFSSVYGIFSLLWGWLADKLNNHWSMMVIGLFMSSVCLIVLGPSPFISKIHNPLWIDMVALCALGTSVSLTLMPTFQSLLSCAVDHGYSKELVTYSMVAGTWSCAYSLGEMIGPTLGAILLDHYGFPTCSTVMAYTTFVMAMVSLVFFTLKALLIHTPESVIYDESKRPLLSESIVHYGGTCSDTCIITFSAYPSSSGA